MRLPTILLFLMLGVVGVYAQPVITTQPASQTVGLGATVTFSVTATDAKAISYQWQFNGTAIGLATSATLTLSSVTPSQAGTYTVYVYDSVNGVTSVAATLSLTGGPVINSSLNAYGYSQTHPFLYTITAEYSPTSFGATGLPPGLSVNTTSGVISGIPTTTGTFQVTLTALNASGTGTATLNLTISLPPYVFSPLQVVPNVAFSNLAGIVRGGVNLFYVADTGNSTIYQFNPATLAATVFAGSTGVTGASDGTGTASKFNNPTGLAIDSGGNVYVADTANSAIRKVSGAGVVTTLAGVAGEPGSADGPLGTAHFNYPQGIAVDSNGNVYVADTGNSTIREISASGTVTTIAGTAGSSGSTDGTGSAATFGKPTGLVIDSKGNLYVEDSIGTQLWIRKITTGAAVTTVTEQNTGLLGMGGVTTGNLAIDSSDDVFFTISQLRNTSMTEITPSGATFSVGPLSLNNLGSQNYMPTGMTFDQSGHAFSTLGTEVSEGIVSSGPTILSQPSISVSGQNATISISASAYPSSPYFQWLLNGVPINSGTWNSEIIVPINANTVGTYSVIVGSGTEEVISDNVILSPTPPFSISTSPNSQAVASGASATFSVTTTGTVAPTYQWAFNGTAINGATSSSYTVSNAAVSNSGAYSVTVTDQGNSVTSQSAFLTITAASGGPTISSQTQSLTSYTGGTVVLNVSLSSTQGSATPAHLSTNATSAPTYQWYFNGAALADSNGVSGSQTQALVLSGLGTKAGSYSCLVESSTGSALSTPATLTLSQTNDIGRLTNVSCRAPVGTGSNVLIAGFIVGGTGASGTDSVLVRASGPALSPFGVSGTLPDPELQLFNTSSGSNLVATNSGWAGNSLVSTTAASVGAFAWASSTSHDAALVESLAPGPFTANVAGQSNDTGIALAEVYDATPSGTYVPSMPRLVNISARVQVGTGANVLIAGFVVGGSTSKTVLIRASGPALKQFSVTGTLPDPELQLYQSGTGGSSTLIGTNMGWGGTSQIATEATSVGAFSWGTSATADSALLVTLPPGGYTAQVSGASGDTGISLVEVYEVP